MHIPNALDMVRAASSMFSLCWPDCRAFASACPNDRYNNYTSITTANSHRKPDLSGHAERRKALAMSSHCGPGNICRSSCIPVNSYSCSQLRVSLLNQYFFVLVRFCRSIFCNMGYHKRIMDGNFVPRLFKTASIEGQRL
jgi:hypothetical protein